VIAAYLGRGEPPTLGAGLAERPERSDA
jgi:hypothetical protein